MAEVKMDHLTKVYDDGTVAVDDFTLDVADREFLILVGPSGCGKTTTLRMIAGLEEITSGDLFIDGKLVNNVEPKDRDIAMVFQNYALYPDKNVYNNMAFGLKVRKVPKAERDRRVREAARILDLEPYLKRKPKALSGGQKQRVAMGRAIVRDPKVFLMDEPLSNLDAKLRGQMRVELTKLHRRLGATIIYVTHDQIEAMTLGTRIVVMNEGVIQQVDTPKNLYQKPANMFVAGFIGAPQINFLEVECREDADAVRIGAGVAWCEVPDAMGKALAEGGYAGGKLMVGVRPEDLVVRAKPADSGAAGTDAQSELALSATVRLDEPLGAETYLYLDWNDNDLVARVEPDVAFDQGTDVEVLLPVARMHFFDPESQNAVRP